MRASPEREGITDYQFVSYAHDSGGHSRTGARRIRMMSNMVTAQGVPAPSHSLTACNAPNLVALVLGEPEIAIWPIGDSQRLAIRHWQRKFAQSTCGRDTPSAVAKVLRKPEVAV